MSLKFFFWIMSLKHKEKDWDFKNFLEEMPFRIFPSSCFRGKNLKIMDSFLPDYWVDFLLLDITKVPRDQKTN